MSTAYALENLAETAQRHRTAEHDLKQARHNLDQAIISARKSGVQQTEVAALAGMSVATIRRITNG